MILATPFMTTPWSSFAPTASRVPPNRRRGGTLALLKEHRANVPGMIRLDRQNAQTPPKARIYLNKLQKGRGNPVLPGSAFATVTVVKKVSNRGKSFVH